MFDGVAHTSVLSHDELYPRSFVVSSFGKTYHVTGWKTGYVVAPPALSAELRKVHQYVNFCGVTPLQWALADYMAGHPEHLRQLPGFYQAKRDLFCALLTREHGVAAIPVSVFYEKAPDAMRLVRFCYAKREETLRQAAEKLCAI